jgi:hypothetical protein
VAPVGAAVEKPATIQAFGSLQSVRVLKPRHDTSIWRSVLWAMSVNE